MSDSDDPWPGACCGRINYVTSEYYNYRYTLTESFCIFFKIDPRARYTMYQIEGFILDYIATHNGYTNKAVTYDEALWNLFGLSPAELFSTRRMEHYVQRFQRGERPCPICEQLRPFHPRIPNGLCDTCCCSPDLLDSAGQPATVQKRKWVPLSAGFFTHSEVPTESHFTLHGVACRRTNSDDILLEAIVRCPICHMEVKEELRLGALCDRCASSESLVDANRNRVRFEPASYNEIGFKVVSYETGEITERLHVGEFPCFYVGEFDSFFNNVPCIAEDTGTKERVIVRFRESVTVKWRVFPPPQKNTYSDGTETIKDQEEWLPSTDWLDPGYPRWAMWKSDKA